MRRTVLSLVAARAVTSRETLRTFFENTFYWHQILEHNPKLLDTIVARGAQAVDWLLANHFIEESHSTLLATPLGRATAISGLLPETAKQFVDMLRANDASILNDFKAYELGLLHGQGIAIVLRFEGIVGRSRRETRSGCAQRQ